jgi:hypothetical protein
MTEWRFPRELALLSLRTPKGRRTMDYDKKPSTADKAKEALKRDWEQTKHDITRKGPDLDQNVGDTLKQATGKEPIPPPAVPNFKK